jgi:hypothetical protein
LATGDCTSYFVFSRRAHSERRGAPTALHPRVLFAKIIEINKIINIFLTLTLLLYYNEITFYALT